MSLMPNYLVRQQPSFQVSKVAGKYTYSNSSDVWFDSYERIMTSKEMIREGYRNVIWFDQNKVNIIYRPSSWSHPYFHKPRQDIFVTNEFYEINDGNEEKIYLLILP